MDTIYALSTGPSVAGVAVIRISGPSAYDVADLFGFSLPPPRFAGVRNLHDPDSGEHLDRAVVLAFAAPHTFTGEAVVELHLHGSRAIVRSVLAALGRHTHLRPADPGEFTRRAFLNGKMDLVDVEALSDLLQAETRSQARLAETNRRQLKELCELWRESLVEIRGLTEALIDFPDEDDVVLTFDSNLQQLIGDLRQRIELAAQPSRAAEIVQAGYRVALMGAPNAGKSSLLNALARRDVAITSPTPGTTRDLLEVRLDLDGQSVILVDTAGLRATEDEVEVEGIRRSRLAAEQADLRLWLLAADDNQPVPGERQIGDLVIGTKSDLFDSDSKQFGPTVDLTISAKSGDRMDALVDILAQRARAAAWMQDGSLGLVHERQRSALRQAISALVDAEQRSTDQLELRAEALRVASVALDRLIGRIEPDQVLDVVFSRFCIGK